MKPSPPPHRTRWILILAAATLALTAGAAVARLAWIEGAYAELLRQDADAIPSSARLIAFAEARAPPLYDRNCAGCHGVSMTGDRNRGAPSLIDGDWLYGDGGVSDIEQTLQHGIRSGDPKGRNLASMPAFATADPYPRYKIPPLSPVDIRDLTEYLYALEGRPADRVSAARGGVVFHTRGGCYDCHGADGGGDGAIGAPNLRDAIWLYGDGSRGAIFDSIAYGRAGACPGWTGRLTAGEIRALAVYIFARSHVVPVDR